ncbi:MAG: hypothetical protein ACOYS2_00670 [Patescibacteria group bacterium]
MTCQFETPTFIYYSYSIAIALGLALGFLILWKDRKSEVNRSAFYFILALMLWTINDYIMWMVHDAELNLFLFRISVFADAVFLLFLYFAYAFSGKPLEFRKKILWAVPLIPNFILFFSDINVRIHDLATCSFADGPIIYYAFILDAFYVLWSTKVLLGIDYKKAFWAAKYQTRLLISSIWIFTLASFAYWVSWSETFLAETSCYFILCSLLSIFLIALAIIKWELFNFKTVLTMGFSIFIITAIFLTMFLFSISAFFTGFLIFMYLLIVLIYWKM